jgi:hypothetical protein
MVWTSDAAATILSAELYWAVRVAEGEIDPAPFVTLSTHDQAAWTTMAQCVIDVLVKRDAVNEYQESLLPAAEAITRRFIAIRGGKL